MKALLATIAAVLAAPAPASAAGPTMSVRDVPLHAARTAAAAAPRFDMLGLHWRGAGAVLFRTRGDAGRWSRWRAADADPAPGWRLGDLAWTGPATAAEFRTRGTVTRLRAYYVSTAPELVPARRLALANAPPIVPRLSWGANEAIRRAPPQYAPAIRYAVVHHTAGSNAYTRAQSAAIVRGIELYHVEGNGWNDIGYNFLVDKYGQVFEGRYGGVDRPVIGAHSLGFNDGSFGVAVIGDYNATGISAAARRSLEQLLAWKLDLAHVDPLSFTTVTSGGNPRFPAGVPVLLRAISGHRDTNFTDCPGNALYAQLPGIARDVAALGLPKLYEPLATGTLGGPVHFTARLSSALPWTVTVADATGLQVAQGAGSGSAVDWTWDATLAEPQAYAWTIAAPGVRAATGTIGRAAPALAIRRLVLPAQVAPGETAAVTYTLTVPATVNAILADASGATAATLFDGPQPAGPQTLALTAPPGLAAGTYTILLTATTASGRTATASAPVVVDDILSGLAVSPPVFSAALHASAALTFTLARAPSSFAFEVLRGSAIVSFPAATPAPPGPQTLTWDGTLDDGNGVAPDGTYTLALEVGDGGTTFTRGVTVRLDSTPPRITPLSYANLRFRLSEPVTLTLVVAGRRYSRTLAGAATTQFWLKRKPKAYTLLAADAAGNTATLRYPRR